MKEKIIMEQNRKKKEKSKGESRVHNQRWAKGQKGGVRDGV